MHVLTWFIIMALSLIAIGLAIFPALSTVQGTIAFWVICLGVGYGGTDLMLMKGWVRR